MLIMFLPSLFFHRRPGVHSEAREERRRGAADGVAGLPVQPVPLRMHRCVLLLGAFLVVLFDCGVCRKMSETKHVEHFLLFFTCCFSRFD